MKRALGLLFITAACIVGFLPIKSQPSLIFAIVTLVLLALFLYSSEIKQGWSKLHRRIFSPAINEEKSADWMIARKIEATEQKMTAAEQALEKFATAIADYAQHMASHTSAIQGLSAASHELKRGAAEQNRILMHFMETIEPPVPAPDKQVFRVEKPVTESIHKMPEKHQTQFPPGCVRNRRTIATQVPSARPGHLRSRRELIIEALAAERKILDTINQRYDKPGESSS